MRGLVALLVIYICLSSFIAQGNIDVPLIKPTGFEHGAHVNVMIMSGSYSAWIFLDNKNASRKTPNELEIIKPGNHTIMLEKDETMVCKKEICISKSIIIAVEMNKCDYNITQR